MENNKELSTKKPCDIHVVRQCALTWWNNLTSNPLLRLIRQGELTTKHYGQFRIPKSLTGREIQKIYELEHFA